MNEKIMSRVLVGFDETTDFRGRTDGRTHAEMDMDFLNVCHTRAPSGQIYKPEDGIFILLIGFVKT